MTIPGTLDKSGLPFTPEQDGIYVSYPAPGYQSIYYNGGNETYLNDGYAISSVQTAKIEFTDRPAMSSITSTDWPATTSYTAMAATTIWTAAPETIFSGAKPALIR
ncbi:hypothetical protein [Inquilinus limosus]|uniref:hypothetical protein n=1 Tax=Inquilinus limosus TaxID=171674 RepID=UPI001377B714|nr:hypothetical protein [Inquilinus limosus]